LNAPITMTMARLFLSAVSSLPLASNALMRL